VDFIIRCGASRLGNEGNSCIFFGLVTGAQNANAKNSHFDLWMGFNHMTTPLVSLTAGLTFVFQDWHFSDSLAMEGDAL